MIKTGTKEQDWLRDELPWHEMPFRGSTSFRRETREGRDIMPLRAPAKARGK